ncbi:MAG TPA: hypothetical protein VGN42_14185 [Pirellulales bacterium]|nr:hypothetical protein [Pirellulales bacterium]
MDAASRTKRRWFQFSLRTFLVLFALLGIALGRHVERAKRQKLALVAWQELGAEIGCRHQMARTKFGTVYFDSRAAPPGPAALRPFLGAEHFETVVKLQLITSKQISEQDFAALADLPDLRTLEIYARFQLTDEAVSHLRGLARLERLVLANVDGESDASRISGACLDDLAGLASLQELFLLDQAFSDADLATLRRALPDCNIIH